MSPDDHAQIRREWRIQGACAVTLPLAIRLMCIDIETPLIKIMLQHVVYVHMYACRCVDATLPGSCQLFVGTKIL